MLNGQWLPWRPRIGVPTNGGVVAEAFQEVEAFLSSAEWVGRKRGAYDL